MMRCVNVPELRIIKHYAEFPGQPIKLIPPLVLLATQVAFPGYLLCDLQEIS